MTVVGQRRIAANVFELKLTGKMAEEATQPGRFVHVRVGGNAGRFPLLRRPISICCCNPGKREMTLIYKRVGVGTAWLADVRPGEQLDVLGPLGNGFSLKSVPRGGRALIVGGGVGVPPLYGLAKAFAARAVVTTHILGFRSAADCFYERQFAALGQTILLTEDGSAGRRGLVTDVLDSADYDAVFACGPLPMLRALSKQVTGIPLYLSMEQRMGCGIGACLACAVQATDPADAKGYRRVCCDGPVFRAGEVELC